MTGRPQQTLPSPSLVRLAHRAGLVARASATWPPADGGDLPALPGFIASSFSPLVAEVAERCLRAEYGDPPAPAVRGIRTALIIASEHGDGVNTDRVARAVATGGRIGPLLFFQAVPNAVAGYVATRWQLAGPVACLGSARAGIDVAALLIADGDADEALVILAEQSPVDTAGDRVDTAGDRMDTAGDRAEAVLLRPERRDREVGS